MRGDNDSAMSMTPQSQNSFLSHPLVAFKGRVRQKKYMQDICCTTVQPKKQVLKSC